MREAVCVELKISGAFSRLYYPPLQPPPGLRVSVLSASSAMRRHISLEIRGSGYSGPDSLCHSAPSSGCAGGCSRPGMWLRVTGFLLRLLCPLALVRGSPASALTSEKTSCEDGYLLTGGSRIPTSSSLKVMADDEGASIGWVQ